MHCPLDFLGKRPRLASVNAVLVLLILALAVPGAARNAPVLRTVPDQVDFATYYLAAVVLNSANPVLYRDDLLEQAAEMRGVQEFAPPYVYPPMFAGLLRPLAILDFGVAKQFWFGLNVLFLALSAPILVRLSGFPLRARWIIGSLILVGLFPPVHQALDLGQVSPMLLLLCGASLAMTLDSTGRITRAPEWLAGGLLALAAMVKVFPAILVPYAAFVRRTSLLATSVLGLLLGIAIGVPIGGGVGNTTEYLALLPSAYGERLTNVIPTNLSFSAFFLRLFAPTTVDVALLTKDSVYKVEFAPMANDRGLALSLTFICTLVVLGVTALALLQLARKPVTEIRYASGFCAVLMASLMVISTSYYHLYVLLLVPLAILLRVSVNLNRPVILTTALLVYLLVVIQRYSNWLAVFTRSPFMVSFGLYAALLLWGVMIYLTTASLNRIERQPLQ